MGIAAQALGNMNGWVGLRANTRTEFVLCFATPLMSGTEVCALLCHLCQGLKYVLCYAIPPWQRRNFAVGAAPGFVWWQV